MAFNTVAAAFSRALRSGGNGTPPLLRSAKVNGLSASRTLSGGNQQDRQVAKSSDSCADTDRPGDNAPASSEAAHKSTPADKKGTKEPVRAPGVRGERRRSLTSTVPADPKSYMWARYNDTKRLVHGKLRDPHHHQHIPHIQQPSAPSVVFGQRTVLVLLNDTSVRACLPSQLTTPGTWRLMMPVSPKNRLIPTLSEPQQPKFDKSEIVVVHSSSIFNHPAGCLGGGTNKWVLFEVRS